MSLSRLRPIVGRTLILLVVITFAGAVATVLAGIPALIRTLIVRHDLLFADPETVVRQLASMGLAGQISTFAIVLPLILAAGLSESIGQSYILFANGVRPLRFALTVTINAVLFLFGFLETVAAVWLVGWAVHGRGTLAIVSILAVAISYQPMVLAFLGAVPYLGTGLLRLLYFASYVLLAEILVQLGFPRWQAFLTAVLALGAVYITRATVGRPIAWLSNRVRELAAGTRLEGVIEAALGRRDDYTMFLKEQQ